ncbi:hypothetical protein DRJ17_00350 [Candidatus Woesearchaeota archaeon]|nr:MAG: hypothetical protein DRJ17_00350 [Candidatus Woesearchaeota archaeon]
MHNPVKIVWGGFTQEAGFTGVNMLKYEQVREFELNCRNNPDRVKYAVFLGEIQGSIFLEKDY